MGVNVPIKQVWFLSDDLNKLMQLTFIFASYPQYPQTHILSYNINNKQRRQNLNSSKCYLFKAEVSKRPVDLLKVCKCDVSMCSYKAIHNA